MKSTIIKFLVVINSLMFLCCVALAQPTQTENYVVTHVIRQPGIDSESMIALLPIASIGKMQTVSYVDGLGRPKQSVITEGSVTHHDIISPVEFDAFGRQVKNYLPYVDLSTTGNYGKLHGDWNLKQPDFYNGQLMGVDRDVAPFSTSVLESSPVNRVLSQGAPGQIWQPNTLNPSDTNQKTIKIRYEVNSLADNVRVFNIDDRNNGSSPGMYAAGQLDVKISLNEHNSITKDFTDKEGHVILKRVYITSDSLQTYYVYDDIGKLRVVIQPEGVAAIPYTGTWSPSAAFISQWMFLYRYDFKNRMVMKKVPGADSVKMFYDQWDRLVLTQDSVQRKVNQYLFTKYDALDRPIVTGLYTDTRAAVAIQSAINATTGRFESVNTAVNEGYTLNNSFPSSASYTLNVVYNDLL